MNETILILSVLILFLLSLSGIFLPFLPGVFLSWIGVLAYASYYDFTIISIQTVVLLFILFLLTVGLDLAAPLIGAKTYKASPAGIAGTFLGLMFGLLFLGPVGLILGPMAGALLGELAYGRSHRESAIVALGSFAGFFIGSLFKVVAVAIMFGVFLSSVWQSYRTGGIDLEIDRVKSELVEKSDLIKVESPRIGEVIKSPLRISGQARGYWFFEASFPITLLDADRNVIARNFIMTSSEWMTTDFVPFESSLEFTKPEGVSRGYLILHKDNPSGLPEHDNQVEIPVVFE